MSNELQGVDKEIYDYACSSTSFLLLAGAGSGKTRTLVNVLQEIKETKRDEFLHKGQKVAVITYTNAACDEIKRRLGYDSTFWVSTIHSFAWELIQSFTENIRDWKTLHLNNSIEELQKKENKARTPSSRANYEAKRLKKEVELEKISNVVKFIYSPTDFLSGLGALTHSDVIKICADFLNSHNLMRKILVNQFPVLFIDECQDTQKDLLKAIISTQQKEPSNLSVGLFGDLLQRIYSDGYAGLLDELPNDWKLPQKKENYRSPKRIVGLINKIRENEDEFQQIPMQKEAGNIRLFITSIDSDKTATEEFVKSEMATICQDALWKNEARVETLALEHKMIARRIDFLKFYDPISQNNSLKDGLLNGTGSNVLFLKKAFIPLVESIQQGNDFSLIRILEKNNAKMQDVEGEAFLNALKEIKKDIDNFTSNISNNSSIKDLLEIIHNNRILNLPDDLVKAINIQPNDEDIDEKIIVWSQAIEAPYKELIHYFKYVDGELGYSTHQGVKGLEYPRVMTILDDDDAGGFLFSYEKLFGAKELSATDVKNENEGKDTTLSRTRRLFYVICSRAEESLAIVVYSEAPNTVKKYALDNDWFNEDEIEIYP